jgi:hypothetical protein
MRIVEEQHIVTAACAMPTNARDEFGGIPFVYENQVGVGKHAIQIESSRVIAEALELRVKGMEPFDGGFGMERNQIPNAPGVAVFVNAHIVAARDQFRGDSAKEVRVAVIPI